MPGQVRESEAGLQVGMEEERHYPSVVEGEENLPHHLPELVAEGEEEFR